MLNTYFTLFLLVSRNVCFSNIEHRKPLLLMLQFPPKHIFIFFYCLWLIFNLFYLTIHWLIQNLVSDIFNFCRYIYLEKFLNLYFVCRHLWNWLRRYFLLSADYFLISKGLDLTKMSSLLFETWLHDFEI